MDSTPGNRFTTGAAARPEAVLAFALLYVVLGLVGLIVRRPRDWRVIVTLWIAAGLVLLIHAASQGVTPEFALPLYPVFIVTALGALLGARPESARADPGRAENS